MGAGPKLLFGTQNPKLVLKIAFGLARALLAVAVPAQLPRLGVAHPHAGAYLARMFSLRAPEVRSVTSSILGGLRAFEPVAGVDLVLVLGGYLPFVVEGRNTLDRILIGGAHQALLPVSHLDDLPRNERGLGTEEARFDTHILRLVVLVDEKVVYLTDLATGGVVDPVTGEVILKSRKPIRALFALPRVITPRGMFGCSLPITILYRSGLSEVLSLHALPMLGHLVVDFLTFLKGPEPSALYIGVVDEDVPAPMVGGDEAVAFFLVEPANRSLGHMQELPLFTRGSTATKKPPLSCRRRFHQNKTQILVFLEHTTLEKVGFRVSRIRRSRKDLAEVPIGLQVLVIRLDIPNQFPRFSANALASFRRVFGCALKVHLGCLPTSLPREVKKRAHILGKRFWCCLLVLGLLEVLRCLYGG